MRTEMPFLSVAWVPTVLSLIVLFSVMDCRSVSTNGQVGSTPMLESDNTFSHNQAGTRASRDHPSQNVRLEDTDWIFIRFGDDAANETREPGDVYLRLRSKGNGMRLFDGCNVIFGRYQLKERKLRFLIAGKTEWECTRAGEQRRQLFKMLEASSGWDIIGEKLELYSSGSKLLARFEVQTVK